jgi:hypothetical protein
MIMPGGVSAGQQEWLAGWLAGWLVGWLTTMMDVAVGSSTHKHAGCGQQRESCSYGS